ncbi:MAG TPA: wax ester/triacylglycerol synthase domain-containing protein [Ilumatobacteraceae bacterium]|nr:wax ester/triacylglycerol synthase domain-containing protein [Ilumatobacteraceae bacterium]
MSDAEGLMWRVDKDPHLSSTFASVSVLDRPPDFDALRARMEQATWAVPRLRWRVQPAPVNLSAPTWVDDPDFDIDNHVRRIALPKPGTMRQLLDLATLFANDALDRTRPLWQFVVIEGLRGGRAALVQKMHHTITDGEGGVQMSLQFLDFERNPPPRPPVDPSQVDVAPPPPPPSAAETVRDLLAGGFRLPIGVARQVHELLADPTAIPAASAATIETIRGVVQQLSDVDRARSPLWTERSLRRHVEVVRAPFRATKDAARRLGGTLNTAFITAAAEAAGRYHDDLGAPVDALRTTMAISTRRSAADTNAFTLARMMVPTSAMPVDERFRLIQAIADEARVGSGGASLQTLAAVAAALPTSLVTRLARQQAQTIDFATSNVKAAPMPVYIAGAELLENYPFGPLAGVAFNLTLLSYNGSLDMGINIDAAAVAEPERLATHLAAAFADLVGEPVGPARARASGSSGRTARRGARQRPRSRTPARG